MELNSKESLNNCQAVMAQSNVNANAIENTTINNVVEELTDEEIEREQEMEWEVINEVTIAIDELDKNESEIELTFSNEVADLGIKDDFGWVAESCGRDLVSTKIERGENLTVLTLELAVSDDTPIIDRIASELHDMYVDADYYGQKIVLNDWMYEEEFGCVHLTDIFNDESNIEYFTRMSGVECHRIWASGVGEVTFDVDWSDVIPGDEIIDQVNDLIFKWYETHQVKGFDDDFNDAVENAAEELGFSVEDTWNCVDYDEMVKALSNTLAVAVAE